MTLKKNIIASYIGQFSLAIICIVMMPMYIKYMGAEAYGLVGFYVMLQALTQLIDMGMTPTIIRETARYRGGEITRVALVKLIRTLETIFWSLALCLVVLACLFSALVARNWLIVEHIPLPIVQTSILLIVSAVILRWVSSLYRGIISGFEELVWLAGYNVSISIARFIFVMPFILWVDNGPVTFFAYQLLISISEIIVLRVKANSLYERRPGEAEREKKVSFFYWSSLQGVMKFSITIAFTTSIWAIVTQSDKLILSKILTLTDYAYFTLAVLAASGINLLGNTVGVALMPRFTKLNAENKNNEVIALYRIATRFIGVFTIPATLAVAFFAEPILFVWTGDIEIASKAANVLSLYCLGNGLLVFNAFPYYLQYANGNLRLHFIGSILFALLFLPLLIVLTIKYGVIGAGWAWLQVNLIVFFTWVAFTHRQLWPNLHLKWLINDIGTSLVYCLPIALAFNYFITWAFSRQQTFWVLVGICIVLVLSTLIPFLYSRKLINPADIRRWYEKYLVR